MCSNVKLGWVPDSVERNLVILVNQEQVATRKPFSQVVLMISTTVNGIHLDN